MDLSVGGKVFQVERLKLRKWFELSKIHAALDTAAKGGHTSEAQKQMCAYLAAATGEKDELFAEASWQDVAAVFADIGELNTPKIKFPMLDVQSKDSEGNPLPWDYEGRGWYSWVHIFGNTFGWSIEYISELDVDDAIGLMQEILVDDQLNREWTWGMSEIAYEYVASSKTSRLRKLTRPDWMREKTPLIKKIRIPVSMMPVGVVIDLNAVNDGTNPPNS